MKIVCHFSCGLKAFEGRLSPRNLFEKSKLLEIVDLKVTPVGEEGFGFVEIRCLDEYFDRIIQAFVDYDIHPTTSSGFLDRKEAIYSRAELDAAELLETELDLHPAAKFASDDPQVDLKDACHTCWSGAKLVPDVALKFEKRAMRSAINQMYEGNRKFLDDAVRDALLKAGAHRGNLVRAACITGEKQVELRSIIQPATALPRLHPSTRGITQLTNSKEAPCAVCGRDGFFGNRDALILALERRLVEPLITENKDRALLASTWECFGIGVRSGRPKRFFPNPSLVVNQAARRTLMASTTAKFRWAPILLVD